MKILFICGCLEKGRDGVGDYTRKLAETLIHQQKQTLISVVALNDSYISELVANDSTLSDRLYFHRIPATFNEKNKFSILGEIIDNFKPDWISLQFVPYAYHPKGLPVRLANNFKKTWSNKIKLHIMFHELWVGMAKEISFKLKVVGKLQRRMIKDMLQVLKPSKIHTQCNLYKVEINLLGFDSEILSLFSNIDNYGNNDFIPERLNVEEYNFVIFGSIHAGAPIKEFAAYLSKKFASLRIHFVGGNGTELNNWKEILDVVNIPYIIHGRQSEKYISSLLSKSQLGISTTPYFVSQKSGSIAAMLLHGLPVICVSPEWTPWVLCNNKTSTEAISNADVIYWNDNLKDLSLNSFFNFKKYDVDLIAENFYTTLV